MIAKTPTTRRTRRNVGVIGLGIIGARVADNLRHRGFHAFVWNRTPKPVPNFVGSPGEVAELCDVIQIFVGDDEALLQMVQRMTSKLTPRHIIIANSTVAPDTVRAAAEIVGKRGARFLDVPFTGSKAAAANAQLVYYAGGDSATLEEVRSILEASSKVIVEIGEVGQASAMKVATNIMTAAIGQAAAEALALVANAGLSPEKFQLAMQHNSSNSTTLDIKLPKMLGGDFEPQFSVKHMLKDMTIAARLARAAGIELGVADAARRALVAEEREGRGDADFSSLVRAFFPNGMPVAVTEDVEKPEADEHPTLTGLDEQTPAPPETEPTIDEEKSQNAPEPKIEAQSSGSESNPAADQPETTEAEIEPQTSTETEKSPIVSEEGPVRDEQESVTPAAKVTDVKEEVPAVTGPTGERLQELADIQPAKVIEEPGRFRRFFRRGSDD